MTKTFAERCHIAQQFLPDAQYKAMLTALHEDMLAKLAEQPAPVQKREPITDEQRQKIHNETGAGFALIRLVEIYLKEEAAHNIKENT